MEIDTIAKESSDSALASEEANECNDQPVLDECAHDHVSSLPQVDCSTLPDFPEILSFLDKFAPLLDLQNPVLYPHLKLGAENSSKSPEWRMLHCNLMRRINKTFKAERWTQELLKLCARYGVLSEDIEGGYSGLSVEMKLDILKLLCDLQFVSNPKFKEKLEALDPDTLRTEPIGRDKHGSSYFYFQDSECNLYLYSSPASSLEKFDVVATDRQSLCDVIDKLKAEAPVRTILNGNGSLNKESDTKSEHNGEERSQSQNSLHSSTSHPAAEQSRPSTAVSSSVDAGDTPEKTRGVTSPTVSSTSPSKATRGASKRCTVSPTESSSTPTDSSFESSSAASTKKIKGKKASKTPEKNASKKASPLKNGKGRGRGRASKRASKSDSEADSDSDESVSDNGKLNAESDESESEEETLAVIKSTGRTPRVAAAKASVQLSKQATPTKQALSAKTSKKGKPVSVTESDEEESDELMSSEDEEEYVPSSARRGRPAGRGRGRGVKVTPPLPKFISPGKKGKKILEPEPIDSTDIEDDTECQQCRKFNHPGKLLLCDKCDYAYHTFCLVPPVALIPEGDWFCPACEHHSLIEKLDEILIKLDLAVKELEKKRAKEEKGRKELARLMSEGWSGGRQQNKIRRIESGDEHSGGEHSDGNEVDYGVRSCRRKNRVDYSLADYDRKIHDAITGKYEGGSDEEVGARRRGRSNRIADEDGGNENGNTVDKEMLSDEEDRNSEDYKLPEWTKEMADGESPIPRRNRSPASDNGSGKHKSDEESEYQPSEEEIKPKARSRGRPPGASKGSAKRGRGRSQRDDDNDDDDEDEYVPTPEKKPPTKRPKNWEEEDYHMSWDDDEEEEWDSDAASDFGGRKRKRGGQAAANTSGKRKKQRFLYASSESDSDNEDYDDYKAKSTNRHRGRRQFPSSDEEESASEESDSGSEYGRKKRKTSAQKVRKVIVKSKSNKNKRALTDKVTGEEDMVHRSTRLATRGPISYSKFLEEDEFEEEEKQEKRKKAATLGKIPVPFKEEDEAIDEEEEDEDEEDEYDEDDEDKVHREKPTKPLTRPVKREVASEEEVDEEESSDDEEEEDFEGKSGEEIKAEVKKPTQKPRVINVPMKNQQAAPKKKTVTVVGANKPNPDLLYNNSAAAKISSQLSNTVPKPRASLTETTTTASDAESEKTSASRDSSSNTSAHMKFPSEPKTAMTVPPIARPPMVQAPVQSTAIISPTQPGVPPMGSQMVVQRPHPFSQPLPDVPRPPPPMPAAPQSGYPIPGHTIPPQQYNPAPAGYHSTQPFYGQQSQNPYRPPPPNMYGQSAPVYPPSMPPRGYPPVQNYSGYIPPPPGSQPQHWPGSYDPTFYGAPRPPPMQMGMGGYPMQQQQPQPMPPMGISHSGPVMSAPAVPAAPNSGPPPQQPRNSSLLDEFEMMDDLGPSAPRAEPVQ